MKQKQVARNVILSITPPKGTHLRTADLIGLTVEARPEPQSLLPYVARVEQIRETSARRTNIYLPPEGWEWVDATLNAINAARAHKGKKSVSLSVLLDALVLWGKERVENPG